VNDRWKCVISVLLYDMLLRNKLACSCDGHLSTVFLYLLLKNLFPLVPLKKKKKAKFLGTLRHFYQMGKSINIKIVIMIPII